MAKNEKNVVGLEQKVCVVCGKQYDSGSILISKNLNREIPERPVTGYGLCPEHTKEGFLCIIEVDKDKSVITDGRIKPENAYKTGRNCYIKYEAAENIFSDPEISKYPFIFGDDEIFEYLEKLHQNAV